MLIVKTVGDGKTVHSNTEPLLEQFFAADNFVVQPLLIFRRS